MIERIIYRPNGSLNPIVEGPNRRQAQIQTDSANAVADIKETKIRLSVLDLQEGVSKLLQEQS